MRRMLAVVLLTLLLILPAGSASLAQDATPAPTSAFAELGLPELEITVSEEGAEGFPASLEAGRYLVRLTADAALEFEGGFELVHPVDMTAEEFVAALEFAFGAPAEASPEAATPAEPVTSATPAPGGFMLPSIFDDSIWGGGAYAPAGQTVEVVLDLTPGEWIALHNGDPDIIEVTGEMPADLPEPEENAVVEMGEYYVEIAEGGLTTGSNIVRVDNAGEQPHFLILSRLPDGLTREQVDAALALSSQADATGTPPVFTDFNPDEDAEDLLSTANQSPGVSIWVQIDNLEAGTYGLICFFPDEGDGLPHAYHGMYTIFEVTG